MLVVWYIRVRHVVRNGWRFAWKSERLDSKKNGVVERIRSHASDKEGVMGRVGKVRSVQEMERRAD